MSTAAPGAPLKVPTGEQHAIFTAMAEGKSVKTPAFAGAGKSSTASLVCRAVAPEPVLYVAYNNSMATEMRERLARYKHVRVSTFHSLAFREVGRYFSDRLESKSTPIRDAIERRYRVDLMRISSDSRKAADVVLETVMEFQNSGDFELGEPHVPYDAAKKVVGSTRAIADVAREVFALMTDVSPENEFPATHDTYAKYWQISRPRLDALYKVIIFDEAQDSNPVMLAVLNDQQCAKLVIGDSHQALYKFRSAVNAMAHLEGYEELPLSQSFRFGPRVAALANAILRMKGETRELLGTPSIDTQVVLESEATPNLILARTNVGVFTAAVTLAGEGKAISIVEGTDELIGTILGAYELKVHGRSTHSTFRFFKNWDELQRATRGPRGAEYQPWVTLVDQYNDRLPEVCALVRDHISGAPGSIRISTVHKAKGLEAPHVRLAPDFAPFCKRDRKGNIIFDEDEANVHYVAITRAQRVLELGSYAEMLEGSLELAHELYHIDEPHEIEKIIATACGDAELVTEVA